MFNKACARQPSWCGLLDKHSRPPRKRRSNNPNFYTQLVFLVYIFRSSVSNGSYPREEIIIALHLERWHNWVYRLPKKYGRNATEYLSVDGITFQGTTKRTCCSLCVLCRCSNFFRGFYAWCLIFKKVACGIYTIPAHFCNKSNAYFVCTYVRVCVKSQVTSFLR